MAAIELTRARLGAGLVIPACPLALNAQRKLDERRQRALFRYYLAAGAGGLAVGVHTTQFAIRDPKVGLLQPVLELAAEELRMNRQRKLSKPKNGIPSLESEIRNPKSEIDPLGIAGLCGQTRQAITEATLSRKL